MARHRHNDGVPAPRQVDIGSFLKSQQRNEKHSPPESESEASEFPIKMSFLHDIDIYRKSIPLHWFAFVSALLHLSCLVAAAHGLWRSDYSVLKDENLIYIGFLAYSYDIFTALLLGRSYFYRWSKGDVFIHHLPFMFCGAFWFVSTFHTLSDNVLQYGYTIFSFQQGIRWAMLSCMNEFCLAAAAAFEASDHRVSRLSSTIAGLIYFIVCSPVWLYYVFASIYHANPYSPPSLVLNAAVPVLFAVSQYPLYTKVYWKRLMQLCNSGVHN
jgi:hypothetical protein